MNGKGACIGGGEASMVRTGTPVTGGDRSVLLIDDAMRRGRHSRNAHGRAHALRDRSAGADGCVGGRQDTVPPRKP
jgi:hypothetical protein